MAFSSKLEGTVEFANLAASVIQLMRGHPGTGSATGGGNLGGLAKAIGRVFASLGFTKFDETALAMVVARLTKEELAAWTLIQRKLTDEEKEFLRIVIALMENETIVERIPAKKEGDKVVEPPKVIERTNTENDIRLEFIRKLCALIPEAEEAAREKAAEDVANMLRENNLTGSERTFERFRKIRGWLEKQIAGILGAEDFSMVTGELVRQKLLEWNNALKETAPAKRGIMERLVGLAYIGPQTPAQPLKFNVSRKFRKGGN